MLVLAGVAIGIKCLLIYFDFPFIPTNGYFTTLVTANVFLLGFLISGVLPDYKEAEKLPSEISASLDTIIDESRVVHRQYGLVEARKAIAHTEAVADLLVKWFHKEARTGEVLAMLTGYTDLFFALGPTVQANYISRLNNEVANIRRMVLRVRSIREVPFASPAYAIAECFTFIVILSLLVAETGHYASSALITGGITFVLCYMIALIHDLDNPFNHHDNAHIADEIAISPLIMAVSRNLKKALGKRTPRSKN